MNKVTKPRGTELFIEMFKVLGDTQRQIIMLMYGRGKWGDLTQGEVANALGITEQEVSAKLSSALLKMRVRAKQLGVNLNDYIPGD
jgi:DNA-directed RNA polymerase specialized sigma subunit